MEGRPTGSRRPEVAVGDSIRAEGGLARHAHDAQVEGCEAYTHAVTPALTPATPPSPCAGRL